MEKFEHIITLIFAFAFFYLLFFPRKIVETKIELIPGDTVETVNYIIKRDTIYCYNFSTEYDTLYLRDTTYVFFSSRFFLGDSTLGTSGRVSFRQNVFSFDNIEYYYPEKTKTIIDTFKLFYDDLNPSQNSSHFHFGIVSGFGIGLRTFTPDFFVGVGFSIKVF